MSVREAEISFDKQGLILVKGRNNDSPAFESNGAGKSTIFESITYALFEKTLRGLTTNEVINRDAGKNMSLQLTLEDFEGNVIEIHRYRKHAKYKNSTLVYRNGVNITPKSNRDANKLIENIIQMDYSTYVNSIHFGQGLSFSAASDAEKKAILERILSMDVFSACQDVAKRRLKEAESNMSKIELELGKFESLIVETGNSLRRLKDAEKEQDTKISKEIKELESKLENKISEVNLKEGRIKAARDKLEKLFPEFKRLEQEVEEYQKIEQLCSDSYINLKQEEKEKERIEKELEKLKSELLNLANGVGSICPVCKQDITKESVLNATKHVKGAYQELLEEKKKHEQNISELQENFNTLKVKLDGKDEIVNRLQETQRMIFKLESFLKSEKDLKKKAEEEVKHLEELIKRKEKEKGETFKELIEDKERLKAELETNLKNKQAERDELSKTMSKLEFAVQAFGNSGIKSYLLDAVIPFLNKRANYYLSQLSGNTTEIEFSTQTKLSSGELRDKFEVRIANGVGGDSYKSNSTGERRRIDVAIFLALQDLVLSRSNVKLNILLYDEVFDGLDGVGCENVVNLLREMTKKVDSIFVISHNDNLKVHFDKFLVADKTNGETKIYLEG